MFGEVNSADFNSMLSEYGYPLLHPQKTADPNQLLVVLSKSKNLRLLEGFPVVLANALEKEPDKLNLSATENRLKDNSLRRRFHELIVLSMFIYRAFGLSELASAASHNCSLNNERNNQIRDSVLNNLKLKFNKTNLDIERVKNTFLRYYVHGKEEDKDANKLKLRDEFRQEFFLSLFFAPKQRDLLRKKLRGESLNKTEREYFSRIVKKKLMALVDPDLQRMALKVLQQT